MQYFSLRLFTTHHRLFTSLLPYYGMLALCHLTSKPARGMFTDRSDLIPFSTRQLNYGVAVSDVDGDGEMEWIVAGYSGPNLVLKLNKNTGYYYNLATEDNEQFRALRDPQGQAIGVCACDVDGDGREEIYFLNTNDRYSGPKRYKDKLFKWRRGEDGRERYENLFDDPGNDAALSMFAGRSVAAVDRKGHGKYSVILATYAENGQGSFGLIEMDERASDVARGRIVLRNVAEEAGIAMSTGGRGITVGPIVGHDGHSDIFFDNEGGFRGNDPRNALFVNDGSGRFTNMAGELGLSDRSPGRGVALADFNNDGRVDIVYGNWMDPHRLMLQQPDGTFLNVSSPEMAAASPIRTVIAADFDNDGATEVFYNNIVYRSSWGGSSPDTWENRLFRVQPSHHGAGVSITRLDVGDALEPLGYGTGGAVADMDGDGKLELLLSHGESNSQPLSLYHVAPSPLAPNNRLRVLPLTPHNAPARGAKVTVTLSDGVTRLTRVVDGGSGYLCQMEPVAHFGLGSQGAQRLRVQWPDGSVHEVQLSAQDLNRLHTIPAPGPSRGGRGGPSSQSGSSIHSGNSHHSESSSHDSGSSSLHSQGRSSQVPGRSGYQYQGAGEESNLGASSSGGGGGGGRGSGVSVSHAGRGYSRRTSAGAPYRRGSSAHVPNNRGSSAHTPYRRGSSAHVPYSRGSSARTPHRRGSSASTPYRGSSAGAPYRGSNPRSSGGALNRHSNHEDSCTTTRVSNYIRDDVTGCYSARPIRMGQCQGTCSRGDNGGRCCQPRLDNYRNVLFACRDGRRFRKVTRAGVRHCRCVQC